MAKGIEYINIMTVLYFIVCSSASALGLKFSVINVVSFPPQSGFFSRSFIGV